MRLQVRVFNRYQECVNSLLAIIHPQATVAELKELVIRLYGKLYGQTLSFEQVKNDHGCDVDDDYAVGEVWEQDGIVRIEEATRKRPLHEITESTKRSNVAYMMADAKITETVAEYSEAKAPNITERAPELTEAVLKMAETKIIDDIANITPQVKETAPPVAAPIQKDAAIDAIPETTAVTVVQAVASEEVNEEVVVEQAALAEETLAQTPTPVEVRPSSASSPVFVDDQVAEEISMMMMRKEQDSEFEVSVSESSSSDSEAESIQVVHATPEPTAISDKEEEPVHKKQEEKLATESESESGTQSESESESEESSSESEAAEVVENHLLEPKSVMQALKKSNTTVTELAKALQHGQVPLHQPQPIKVATPTLRGGKRPSKMRGGGKTGLGYGSRLFQLR